MVAEGAVVGMLLDGHELDGVVAGLVDAGEDVVGEFSVGMGAGLLAGHAGVGLVDERRFDDGWIEVVFPNVRFRRAPDLAGIVVGGGILHCAGDGGREAVAAGIVGAMDVEFYLSS